eukprot:g16689.t1
MGAEASARSRREAIALGVTAEVAEQKQELKGGSMLARNRFDPESLVRVVNAVQLRGGGYQPLQPLGETDVEGYLAHHHDMIVLTAVDETRRAAAECSLVRQREWEVDSWRQAKKGLMGETLDGESPSIGNGHAFSGAPMPMLGGGAVNGVRGSGDHDHGRVHPNTPRGDGSLAVIPVVPPAGVNVIPPVSDLPPRAAAVASRLSTLEAGHLAVIQALNDTDAKFPLATRLAVSAGKTVLPGVKNGPEHAYYNALKMLQAMLEGEGWESFGDSTPRSRLDGTLDFLQDQFKQVVEDKVKKAREAGMVDPLALKDKDTGLPFKVRAFMRLDRSGKFDVGGAGATVSGLPVWPQIYICLRCGGKGDASAIAAAAAAASENSRCNGQELALLSKVSDLLVQGKTENTFGGVVQQAFHGMRDGEDVFKQSVLNILSGSDDKKIARINKETIEDYMWFKLSFVGSDVDNSDVLRAAKERVSGRDARRRFDPDGRSPYAYVNVLLYTQQLEAAVAFLHWKGQHFAALHMALVMSHHNAYTAANSPSAGALQYPGDSAEPGPAPALEELMNRGLQGRIDSDPQMCVEYLLRLPVPTATVCLGSLAVRMGAVNAAQFLGYRYTDGTRKKGDLDRFLTEDTVEDVAFEAAHSAEVEGRQEDCISFSALAGDWDRMAALLLHKLVENLNPQAEKRAFWKEIGTKICALLDGLSRGPGAAESLGMAAEGVGQMLRLMEFFVFLQNRELYKALAELHAAGMLPSNHDEAAALAARIRLRGPQDAVVGVLAHALESGMQCLRHHHLEVKRELHAGAGGRIDAHQWKASREQRLADLEAQGRAMVGLAGRLSDLLPASFVADLSRVEANIIN